MSLVMTTILLLLPPFSFNLRNMSEQNSALEPFLLLARSTKGAAAAKVVLDATAAVS